jgi:SAM-dependent methyltransferase
MSKSAGSEHFDNHVSQPPKVDAPVLIVSPGFGQTASDYCVFANAAARHGFRVLRYDHTNHVGMSEGDLQNASVRSMQSDLLKVVEFVRHTWPTVRLTVLASDLSARAALKMAAAAEPLDLLILVNPTLDVAAQLMEVHGHELVSDYQYGLRRGVANLLGLNVDIDHFVSELVAGRLTNLDSSLEDIRMLRTPLCLVASPVRGTSHLTPADLPHTVLTAVDPRTRTLSLPTPLVVDGLGNVGIYDAGFRQILDHIATTLSIPLPPATAVLPQTDSIRYQRRIERERLRLQHNVSQISREALAVAHTQQLLQLMNVHTYRKLLDDLYAYLGPFHEGMNILDTGIGPSELSRALLVNHTYRMRQRALFLHRPPLLIGTRVSGEILHQSRQNILSLQRELLSGTSSGVATAPSLLLGWVQGNWSKPLPFHSRSIHRVVSNLSLPFAESPRETILEWYRVLHPGGRAVFTTFHPRTDLSILYRQHLRLANQDEFGAQPQQVLHYLARLREAICHGILHTFDLGTLSDLLRQLGLSAFRIAPILEEQALTVVLEKHLSAGST